MHVWSPPKLESTVGKKVVVTDLVGGEAISDELTEQLSNAAPQDIGRQTTIVPAADIRPMSSNEDSQVKLAVGTLEPDKSDIALASYARKEQFDYLLRGELLKDRGRRSMDGKQRMTVSWRLLSLTDNRSAGGAPVLVELDKVLKRYPDLALISDEEGILKAAMVRETHRLITPSIEREEVELAIPYLLPGSSAVRKANMLAYNGRWPEAKQIWEQIADKHPLQSAALHNLALASAAEQDFSAAKLYARKAIRARPSKLNKQTLLWIETHQRDYHRAFNLPDPPEGWFVTTK